MPRKKPDKEVPFEKLRWSLDPATLPFETTDDLKPLKEIIGQNRAVEAFRFGMGIDKPGYNVRQGQEDCPRFAKCWERCQGKGGGCPMTSAM
jgi:hypothetical protein